MAGPPYIFINSVPIEQLLKLKNKLYGLVTFFRMKDCSITVFQSSAANNEIEEGWGACASCAPLDLPLSHYNYKYFSTCIKFRKC